MLQTFIRKLIGLCLMGFFLSTSAHAEIKEISSFSEVEALLSPLSSEDLLLLDVDYTLTEPSHPALQMSALKQYKSLFKAELAKFSKEQMDLVPVLMVTQSPGQIIEPLARDLIRKWQDQGILVLGFTGIDTWTLPEIGPIPLWRKAELGSLGIQFKADIEKIEFKEFEVRFNAFPLYHEGILYCNMNVTKGEILTAFLNKTKMKPARVILIDDSLDNLESVQTEMNCLGIPFLGFNYKGVSQAQDIPESEWQEVWDKILKRANELI